MLSCSYVCTQSRAEFRTISYMSGPSKKKKSASIIFNWMPKSGSAEIFCGKAKQKKDGRSFSYHFLIPFSSVLDRGSVRRSKQTGRSFHIPFLDFRAPWGFFALHGNKILLLWLPGHKVPSGAAQASRASEQLQQWRPDMR